MAEAVARDRLTVPYNVGVQQTTKAVGWNNRLERSLSPGRVKLWTASLSRDKCPQSESKQGAPQASEDAKQDQMKLEAHRIAFFGYVSTESSESSAGSQQVSYVGKGKTTC